MKMYFSLNSMYGKIYINFELTINSPSP